MYTCDQAMELLSARLDGGLTPEEAAGLEEHLSRCPDCRALAADLEELHAAMPGLYQEPPPELKERVMAQIRAESAPISLEEVRKKHSGRKVWRSWGAMAAVMAVVFMSAVAMRFGGETGSVSEDVSTQSASICSAQPESGESAAADTALGREKTAVSDGEEGTQSEPSGGETEETQTVQAEPQTTDAGSQISGGDGTAKTGNEAQASQAPQSSGQTEESAGESQGQTLGVTPFLATEPEDTPQENGGDATGSVNALQTAIDPVAAAAGRIYDEILSADWPTGTAAADESLNGYYLTSADGARTAVLRYLRESENGMYSIFKLYETTAGSEDDTLNFYAVPVAGDGEILTAWTDNTPGDDAAFWVAVDE